MAVKVAEDAILVLAPPGQDMLRPEALLDREGITFVRCSSVVDLARLAPRAGGAVISEASLIEADTGPLLAMLEGQPPWSTFPFLMLVDGITDENSDQAIAHVYELNNVTLVETPYRAMTFVSNVKTMLAGRRRQYRSRAQMIDLAQRARELTIGQERQRLLVRELHHRVKNTLANVQALMGSTARSSQTVEEFRQALLGRISALAHVHEVLTEDKWQEAPLYALFASQLDPEHGPDFKGEALLDGRDIKVPSHIAVPLGLAVHELTINSVKYGALSVTGGKVIVTWRKENSESGSAHLRIEWLEENGPPLPVPQRRGFGTQFLERVLHQQTAADVDLNYHPAGLKAEIRLPLPERTHFHLFADSPELST